MKKFILLIALFLSATGVALAGEVNKPITNKENGVVLESDSTYKFSISKSCLSFFSLFSTEPVKSDTLKKEPKSIPSKPLP